MDNRGAIQLTDVVLGFFVLVTIIVLAPTFYTFEGMISASADPFSGLLLTLALPALLLGLLLSIGVSARRAR